MLRRCLCALILLLGPLASASGLTSPAHAIAQANDNRIAAGVLRRGVLSLQLEIVEATWYPEEDGGPSRSVYAFAEKGKAPQIPGPLVRVPQGTEIRVHLHNTLPVPMFIRGLHSHDYSSPDPVIIAAGTTADLHFAAQRTGTFYYSARSTKLSIREIGLLSILEDLPMGENPFEIESQLAGGFVVDRSGEPNDDRVFIITNWMAGVITPPFREVVVINGKSWPYTERLSYRTGDTARWRVVNASLNDHALHLHGFYFEVNSLGDQDHEHPYLPDQVPHVVTRHLDPGETMSIVWTPDRPGHWLFHCHMMDHMSEQRALRQPQADSQPSAHPGHDMSGGMGGMVLGITVSGPSKAPPTLSTTQKVRQLQLAVRETPATRFSLARMGYVIQEKGAKENTDAPPFPGAPLVLTRGEPTEITILNQLTEPTAVHWHGIELESYSDGVPGWSGESSQITPPIPPGGNFVARMTPPRAGTFIYHTHWHDIAQLTGGLYGPLIVVEPGQKFDPNLDKVFLIGREGPQEDISPLLLNGKAQPPPLVLTLGTKYRLRFINIGTNDSDASVALLDDHAKPLEWQAVAKDGWTFPAAQATMRPARQEITVGETYDFNLTADRAGEFTLQVRMRFLKTIISQYVTVR